MEYGNYVNYGTTCVISLPSLSAVALTFASHFEPVRVHRWENMNPRIVQQPFDVRIAIIAVHQVL